MNRREYIKLLLSSGFVSVLNPFKLFADTKPNIHFIGLGGAGTNIVLQIYKNGKAGKFTSINSMVQDNWENEIEFIKFNSLLNEDSTAQDYLNETKQFNKEITSIFRKNVDYKLYVGLGGTTGTLLALTLDKYLKNNGFTYELYASIPFEFESKKRNLANEISAILKFSNHTVLYDLEYFKIKWGNMNFKDFFNKVNAVIGNLGMAN